MSGHSKWSQIKHKKAITDSKKSQVFSKLSKIISVTAKDGSNPDFNFKLKAAIEKAKAVNMPNDNIERAIKKASDKDSIQLETLVLEALGPENVSILIEVITDNKNRTLGEIKNLLQKNNAKIVPGGSIAWQFDKKGVIKIIKQEMKSNFEDLELKLIEAGADNILEQDEFIIVSTGPESLMNMKNKIIELKEEIESAELEYVAKTSVGSISEQAAQQIDSLFEALDDHDDVQAIYSNL